MNKGKKLYRVGKAGFLSGTRKVFASSAREAVEKFINVKKERMSFGESVEFESDRGVWWWSCPVAKNVNA